MGEGINGSQDRYECIFYCLIDISSTLRCRQLDLNNDTAYDITKLIFNFKLPHPASCSPRSYRCRWERIKNISRVEIRRLKTILSLHRHS